jgi:predicted AlkP superfamily phosphohydrolase/phosphomutase
VFWWERVDRQRREVVSTSAADEFDGRYFWRDLPGEAAVVNLPTSYPPPATDGIHVAGGPGAEQSGYTTPPDLEAELEREHDYAVHPSRLGELSGGDPDGPCVKEILALVETRFDVLEDLLDGGDHEFVHLTVFYVNVLQHFFWDHDVVRAAWQTIDERVGDLLDREDVEHLYVTSDHGSNEIATTFHVNAWLQREGYLVTERGVSDLLHTVGLTRERVRPVLASLGVEWWLRRVVPRRLQMLLPDDAGSVDKSAKASVVDWERSTALASGQGPVYVLAENPTERRRVRDELVERLNGLQHGGRTVVEAAVPAEDVYDGPHVERGPDLLLRQGPGVHVDGTVSGERDPFGKPDRWRAENEETGLFVAHGPAVDPEAEPSDMHILDIAPTLLHAHGVAVPTGMDGEVRTDLYAAGSEPATSDVAYRESTANDREAAAGESAVDERLQDLGYLS